MGSFALTVGVAPEFTSGGSATFIAGSPGSFSIRATGSPSPVLTVTGKLPADADKEALFKQFQAWEADQNARAQAAPAPKQR